jgi:hypothetical protein
MNEYEENTHRPARAGPKLNKQTECHRARSAASRPAEERSITESFIPGEILIGPLKPKTVKALVVSDVTMTCWLNFRANLLLRTDFCATREDTPAPDDRLLDTLGGPLNAPLAEGDADII